MDEKSLRDYWQANEARRFGLLFDLVGYLVEKSDELTDPQTVARVRSSRTTEEALATLTRAVAVERKKWLALARERAAADME